MSGRKDRLCGDSGVSSVHGTDGATMLPPAAAQQHSIAAWHTTISARACMHDAVAAAAPAHLAPPRQSPLTCRHGVGRGATGRGDDEAVRLCGGDEAAVDVDLQVHGRGGRASEPQWTAGRRPASGRCRPLMHRCGAAAAGWCWCCTGLHAPVDHTLCVLAGQQAAPHTTTTHSSRHHVTRRRQGAAVSAGVVDVRMRCC